MIRLSDAFVLAYTKLRVHRIRTGVAVGVSGLLFGLIAAVIIVAQGVFSSVDNFSEVGLNNRTILNITRAGGAMSFNEYDMRDDPEFVAEVDAAHKEMIAQKTAAAKKYGITYTASLEDPSPIIVDPQTKLRVIKDSALGDSVVQKLANAKRAADYTPFDINGYVKKYDSAKVIQTYQPIQPSSGLLSYMKDGKEQFKQNANQSYTQETQPPSLMVLDGSLSKPFVTDATFDASKGEIPVIIPYSAAEKLLDLKKQNADTPQQERLDRIQQVRDRIGEVTAKYCYRNNASQALLARAIAQADEIKQGASDKTYVKPALIYTVPSESDCGAIGISADTRSAAQKKQDAQQVLYEKEIGTYVGEPEQHLITVRGVGISSELGTSGQASVAEMTQALFSSWLGYGTWTIPGDLLAKVPVESRPDSIFNAKVEAGSSQYFYGYESYLVEFTNKEQARDLMKVGGMFGGGSSGDVYTSPFGSGILLVDELKTMFSAVLLWVLAVVGGVAIIILASLIGRTVSEGRRESSIFRAIGASRLDIGSIYGTYVVLLALRVILFSAVLAIVLGLTVEILFWKEATLGAQLAYASSDVTKEFHLFSLASPYLLWIAGVILAASVLASIIPILLGARRNPIKDMRNDG